MTFEHLVRPLMEIKKDEWSKTLLTFLYFYLTITAYYILKPARNSLYISYLGANRIPYVVLFIAIVAYFVITLYTWFSRKHDNNKVVTGFLLFSVACLIVFYWLYTIETTELQAAIISFIFYVCLTLFSSITVMQFWVLANDVFDAQAAKRLYGFVGTGGILGGVTGGIIASYAKTLETKNLFLVSAGYIILMIIVYNVIWHREKHNFVSAEERNHVEHKAPTKESIHIVKNSKYLLLVLAIVAIAKFVTVQTEWQYNKFVEIGVAGLDERTAFFGLILAYLSIVALIIQLLVTSKVLKKFSFHGALLPLPFGLLLGSAIIIFAPVLWAASILKISDGSMRYSINQSATNFLYLPVPRQIRYKIKPFIDVCGYQFAKAFGALLTLLYLFIMIRMLEASPLAQGIGVSYIDIVLIAVWFIVIAKLREEYPNEIRRFLKDKGVTQQERKKLDRKVIDRILAKAPRDILGTYKEFISDSHKRSVNIRLAVCVALYEGAHDREGLRKLVEEMVRAEGIATKPDFAMSQHTVDEMLQSLAAEKEASSRYQAIKILSKLREHNGELAFDKDIIRTAITQEIDDYYRSYTINLLYESLSSTNKDNTTQHDFLSVSLRNILDENVERMFRLLGLIYNPVDVYAVYQGLWDENIYVRANALELLDCMVERTLKKQIFPLLDGELSIFGPEKASYFTSTMKANTVDALKEALTSDDRWLCLCAMFMIQKFNLAELHGEIKRLKKSRDGLRREAAVFVDRQIMRQHGQSGDSGY